VRLVAFGVAAIAAAIGTSAFAADGLLPPPPSLPPQGWSFTGCYIGANVGAAWGNSNFNWSNITESATGFSPGAATVLPQAADVSLDRAGFIGGGQAGCNYQPGWLVFGFEGDFGFTNVGVSQTTVSLGNTNGGPSTIVPGNISESFSTDWLSTVRGRVGVASGAWFYYATGGLAIARASFFDQVCFPPSAREPTCNTASWAGTREGWVAGAGIEWKITPAFSTKVEYLFADFDNLDSTSIATTPAGATPFPEATITHDHTFNESILRVGVNYQFVWGAY
jgi:outer membrane immunogenic protein